MTTPLFGYDCASPAPSILAAVRAAYGAPDLVFRYLEEIPGVSTALSVPEVAANHAAGLAVGLCYNGILQGELAAGYARGYLNGQIAARHARALGAPDGVAIFVDVEAGTVPTGDTLGGLAQGITDGRYVAGTYLNGQSAAHAAAYAQYRQSFRGTALIWSSEPEPTAWWNTRLGVWPDFTGYAIGAYAAEVVALQYGEGELGGRADLDVVRPDARPYLWWPGPPPPSSYTVLHTCALKPDASHTSTSIRTVYGGDRVTALAPPAAGWLHVAHAARGLPDLAGYLPLDHLRRVG